ncbi:FAD/NAD(P)-binding domain-containing protein [Apiospora kogelbergensis]|uniref:FAD/NAD(P)-binding domain-containing protein n=1 Tax=Apiospora kogelbergensis TaxID=1337665 RepID=UPI00312FAFCC
MPLDILIVGGGVCGPALATLLLRADPRRYTITVVERYAELRTGGQQIDIRAQGIPVMRKMGLLGAVRDVVVHERGMAFVDKAGRAKFQLTVNDTGKGQQAFTSEYEIMRGDLVRVLYDASLAASEAARKQGGAGVTYEFGVSVESISQIETHEKDGRRGGGVDVTFSDGRQRRFDLVVGADGQGSRTRRQAWGDQAGRDVFHTVHSYTAYFTVPRVEAEDSDIAVVYHMPGRRMIAFRANDRPTTQCYLFCNDPGSCAELRAATSGAHKSVDEQKQIWRDFFQDTDAWCRERVFEGLKNTEDFYSHEAGQVKLESYSRGRVTLLGDAGYCPSPVSGCGTTASLVGAYVLAGELARHTDDDVQGALEDYDRVLRPFTAWGIWFFHLVGWLITSLKIDKLVLSLMPEDKGGWALPSYPELKLAE